MKNLINTYNNVNLIFITYTFLFFKLLIIFMLLTASTVQDESARQRGRSKCKWKDLESGSLEIRKTTIAPK